MRRSISNSEHFALIILGFALFLYGSIGLGSIEQLVISEDAFLFYFVITTISMGMFTNSIIILYLHATESLRLVAIDKE